MRQLFNRIRHAQTKRKLLIGSAGLLLLILIIGLFSPRFVQAAAGDEITIFIIENLMFPILQFLANLLVVVINILISVAQYNDFINAEAVAKGWVIVRDLCNMFFIIVLLVIAFGTLLKLEQYRYNRLLGKLIIYAFLINFSKFIAGFWIDIGQVIMLTFVNGFKNAAAGNLASGLGLAEMVTLAKEAPDVKSTGLMIAVLLGIALLIIAVIVVIIMLAILLFRILMLWFLVVTSPLAFITRVFPGTAKYSDQWWGEFNKYIIVGPVMAFFLWLALTVIAVTGANPPSGFPDISTREGETVLNSELPGVVSAGGAVAERGLSVTITEISRSDRILTFMITIGMLMGALQAAQQLGVAGGKLAGTWSEKIRKGGLTAAGVLSGVAAARLAMRGATGGAKLLGGSARRWAYQNIRPAKFASKEYWEGIRERGKKLEADTQERLRGKGRQQMESWQYKLLRRAPKGVQSIYEDTIDSQQTAAMAENEKRLGRNAGLEKIVRQFLVDRERSKAGGYDEMVQMGGTLINTYRHGHGDDVYQELIAQGLINQHNFKEFGFQNWEEVTGQGKYGGAEYLRARAIQSDSVGVDRGKFDAFVIGRDKARKAGREEQYLQAMLDGTITGKKREELEASVSDIINEARAERDKNTKNASEKEKAALKSMYRASEEARVIGHDEQMTTNYNSETGSAYMMDLLEQRDRVMGERSKMTGQDRAQATLPHAIVQNTYDVETEGPNKGEIKRDKFNKPIMYSDPDPSKITPQGRAEMHDMANIQGRDMSRVGIRAPERILQVRGGSAVRDDLAILDEHGGIIPGKEALYEARVEQDRDAYRKAYSVKFGRPDTPEPLPREPGFDERYKARVARSPKMPQVSASEESAAQAREAAGIPDEARVPLTPEQHQAAQQTESMVAQSHAWSTELPKSVDDMTKAVDNLQTHFKDLTTNLRQIESRLTNPEAKIIIDKHIDTVSDQMRLASNRQDFLRSGPDYQRQYFQKSAQLLEDIAKGIKVVTKPPETPPAPTSETPPPAGEGTAAKPEAEPKPEPKPGRPSGKFE